MNYTDTHSCATTIIVFSTICSPSIANAAKVICRLGTHFNTFLVQWNRKIESTRNPNSIFMHKSSFPLHVCYGNRCCMEYERNFLLFLMWTVYFVQVSLRLLTSILARVISFWLSEVFVRPFAFDMVGGRWHWAETWTKTKEPPIMYTVLSFSLMALYCKSLNIELIINRDKNRQNRKNTHTHQLNYEWPK